MTEPGDPHSLAAAPVVVGVDGTDAADLAVRWAAETAAERRRDLVLAHGMDLAAAGGPFAPYPSSVIGEISDRIIREARALAERTAPTVTVHTRLDDGDPAELLIEYSATAHMVVLGGPTDSGGFGRLGSILLSVVSRANGTVAVVRAGTADQLPRTGPVVVGIDGSPVSEAATGVAFREAATIGAPLVAVHSWADPYAGRFSRLLEAAEEPVDVAAPERALLAERLAGWRERYPSVTVEREVARGTARDQLLNRARAARLLVVGSRGRGRFARFMLGSTSATLVQRAPCPVLVVHPSR
ncbi:universal stress protein [Nocardia bovistercoris]|uniref:Universal stress protein n=1 Tax=Nocardia bovistercoris TaxID=2785916 RepID=A0A931IC10_9NOCA|nr:universal stress protein [Nocardia bovistercoris]MBH0778634.1 universal stress protein [Nocardia bovistercoris]